MTDQTGTPSSPEPPKLRRRLVTAAPAAAPKVKFVSPAAEGVEVVKPRFLTPELQAKLAQEQEEAARRAAEQAVRTGLLRKRRLPSRKPPVLLPKRRRRE